VKYTITAPAEGYIVRQAIDLPASKSLCNRALILQGLTEGAEELRHLSDCDDTTVMLRAFAHPEATTVDIGAAGTSMRFLTAYLATREGRTVTLTGSERMRRRPIGVLVDALRQLGAQIDYVETEGFPPLRIAGRRLTGGEIAIDGSISSQYVSALLMIAPTLEQGLTLHFTGAVTSAPYIRMTLGMMAERGVAATWEGDTITVQPQRYAARSYSVESDWSASSYWYEMVALSDLREVHLSGLSAESLQGDAHIVDYFRELGVESLFERDGVTLRRTEVRPTSVSWDLSGQPDLAQTLVATCCGLGIRFDISGLHTLRIKETDRIAALQTELRRLGYELGVEGDERLTWDGARCAVDPLPLIMTYEDHRMAMALAPLCTVLPGRQLEVDNPNVVSKSYPAYWDHLTSAGFHIEPHN
jgi:3-phosphoshikimate 1-carboxyvinyltransferase